GNGSDLVTLENFVYGDTPDEDMVRGCIDYLLDQEHFFSCSVYELGNLFDIRPLVVKTLLTYLELEGVIKSTGPFYAEYKFKPLKSSAEILARFDAERQTFLRTLFSCAVKKQVWFTIDLDQAVQKTGSPRKRIITALDYLEQSGDLILQVTGARLGFRCLDAGDMDIPALKEKLVHRFIRREENDLHRLQLVVDMVNHSGCRTGFLLNYFGEDLEKDCGHCSFCLDGENTALVREESVAATLDSQRIEQLNNLRKKFPEALQSPRQAARFLCGISSPRLIRTKLTRDALFGSCQELSFAGIMDWIRENV
ncbi:MAG TPA: RecQ family ATP-dependent DNA helicase, partial [Desulfobulbaceae bacterium]|nr:RecQ family ATP-dependent DNA helicase [Desulfobulbaceae bacterium]